MATEKSKLREWEISTRARRTAKDSSLLSAGQAESARGNEAVESKESEEDEQHCSADEQEQVKEDNNEDEAATDDSLSTLPSVKELATKFQVIPGFTECRRL